MPAGTYFEYFYSPRTRGQKYPLQGVTGFNQVVLNKTSTSRAKILALRRMRCVTLALDQTGSLRYSKS